MARDVYVDCIHREPGVAMEAVQRQVQVLRPGATRVIVLSDEPGAIDTIREWCRSLGVRHSVQGHPGYWSLRLYLLPGSFGELPAAVARCRAVAA